MKNLLLICLCFLLVQVAAAQDVIVKVNGEEIKAKVLEITLSDVIYQAPDSLEGKSHSIARSEVFMVRFANGSKEVFQENLPVTGKDSVMLDPAQMYYLGQQDAKQYYKGKGAMWGSAASLSIGPVGLLGSLIIGSTKPSAFKNPVSSQHLLQDINYVNGYEKQAHKRKIGKVAIGAGIGVGISTVVIFGILINSFSSGMH